VSAVRLRGAVVLLGRFPALAGADLVVDAGEVMLVRGPNGAGKSTLLHLCAGLLPLSEGQGEVLGCDLGADRAAVRRRVGLLGHDTALYGELSAAENLSLWARASRVDVAGVTGALSRLGVPEGLWAVPSARLSAGQRRRVALAAITARRPELWLLDEPHAGLDEATRPLVDHLVARVADRDGAVVMVSHDRNQAGSLVTRRLSVTAGTVLEAPA